jgi:hypothetical protein
VSGSVKRFSCESSSYQSIPRLRYREIADANFFIPHDLPLIGVSAEPAFHWRLQLHPTETNCRVGTLTKISQQSTQPFPT